MLLGILSFDTILHPCVKLVHTHLRGEWKRLYIVFTSWL